MKLVKCFFAVCAFVVTAAFATSAFASLKIVVDKSEQLMHVFQDGAEIYTWKVSTGAVLSWTHNGNFEVQSMDAHHRSSKYRNAPMPWSIFYDGDRAIHGTVSSNYSRLGTPASYGCVRLHQKNAETLFNLVRRVGRANVNILVQA